MIKELKYLLFLLVIFFFIFFTVRFYFSDENLKNSYRSISKLEENLKETEDDLVLLTNDTDDVIEFVWPTVQGRNLGYSQHQLHEKLNQFFETAKIQIMTENNL